MNNYITVIMFYLLVFVGFSSNAQTIEPKVVFQIDNKTIEMDSFAVKTLVLKSSTRLTLNYDKKTVKVKIPKELISNTDSIVIRTFSDVKAKVVDIIVVYVCQEQWPVYHCYQCSDGYHKTTTIYMYKNCELFWSYFLLQTSTVLSSTTPCYPFLLWPQINNY